MDQLNFLKINRSPNPLRPGGNAKQAMARRASECSKRKRYCFLRVLCARRCLSCPTPDPVFVWDGLRNDAEPTCLGRLPRYTSCMYRSSAPASKPASLSSRVSMPTDTSRSTRASFSSRWPERAGAPSRWAPSGARTHGPWPRRWRLRRGPRCPTRH